MTRTLVSPQAIVMTGKSRGGKGRNGKRLSTHARGYGRAHQRRRRQLAALATYFLITMRRMTMTMPKNSATDMRIPVMVVFGSR